MHEADVLNLEWTSFPSRDRLMATLVCNYLRYQGYKVEEHSIFDGYHWINTLQPKVLFITNAVGARENFEIVKYASKKGIKVITLISEGNFKLTREFVDEFVWGWNKEKIMYEDLHLQWSSRTKELTVRYYPALEDKIKVSGGVGFDIYKIMPGINRWEFLKKYAKESFREVIGIGCYDFAYCYPGDRRFQQTKKLYPEQTIDRFRQDRKKFNDILTAIVKANPDILFLLKKHPGASGDDEMAGAAGLSHFPNILIIHKEEPIFHCLSVSDFWLVYDSTTAMEAWLMGKQTGLINPSGTDFLRDDLYKGSPNYPSVEDLQKAIDSYYSNNVLPGFDRLEEEREKLVQSIIQFDDGLNHVRAGNEIISLLGRTSSLELQKDSFKDIIKSFEQKILWNLSPFLIFLPKFRFYAGNRKNFREEQLKKFQQALAKWQIEFYEKNNLSRQDLRKIKCL